MLKPLLASCLILSSCIVHAQTLSSPDKKIKVEFSVSSGTPSYVVSYENKVVINKSALGVEMDHTNLHQNLQISKVSPVTTVQDHYTMVNAKKAVIDYKATKRTFTLRNKEGKLISVIFQVSNDGVGFRYQFHNEAKTTSTVTKEFTTYHFPAAAKTWLQPKAEAQTGWEHTNPSYEEYYMQDIKAGAYSKTGWVYPALFKSNDIWVAITETGMDGTYCGTVLKNDSASTVYHIGFPDKREIFTGKGLLPKATGTWYSPWRIITLGNLKTVTESTLGTDLAQPAVKLKDDSFIKPGRSSWSWINSKDDSIVYTEQKRYIDFAAQMKWEYCLIDVNWDTKIGYDKIAELADYGAGKNVGLILWYNSAGSWNTVPYHPKDKLLTKESRRAEFARIHKMGIKGVKIDFFNGDGQSMIAYYTEILADAADFNLLVNFHGATLPRGWARTYPHLMTTEAVKGFEMITFEQAGADFEANHTTMLPFTRNLFDPMDFTPMNLYKIPTHVKRKTTSAFELATSVVFLSGIQHFAESPEGMTHVPDYIKTFLAELPSQWEDVKFLDGEPGKLVVMARKSGNKWYVAGMNGELKAKKLHLDLSVLAKQKGVLFADGEQALTFSNTNITLPKDNKLEITLKENGGFVLVLE
ncbi:glycoside hydrolase family 97 catalytic domain-containing protein [Pedobacter sp. AW31-3R]|uniref:glycoside hydrolase family 97 protein n=1 Tax=Pedobacter sp. AW31-3R TaxID=3445781 RepID=UPI003FA1391A